MTTSRRDVLLQGAVIGAGVIAANMTGMEAWAQASRLRQNCGARFMAWRSTIRSCRRGATASAC